MPARWCAIVRWLARRGTAPRTKTAPPVIAWPVRVKVREELAMRAAVPPNAPTGIASMAIAAMTSATGSANPAGNPLGSARQPRSPVPAAQAAGHVASSTVTVHIVPVCFRDRRPLVRARAVPTGLRSCLQVAMERAAVVGQRQPTVHRGNTAARAPASARPRSVTPRLRAARMFSV